MIACIKFSDIFIVIKGERDIINSITFSKEKITENYSDDSEVAKARLQLLKYLNKELIEFDLKLNLQGSNFKLCAYNGMMSIPYGNTLSYKQLAKLINNPNGSRAIGNACNKNEFIIVVPCHRILKSDGGLGGYAPGLKYKKLLLELENNGGYYG
ncbi:methylated-DNA--[protein]-cysteine S-methyltransferase [Mycoplasma sp. P36-A1]|uniref:methylated-DNA--[protein]-cysteine S-methyltransferase n=1 Tax=Mycoplasma sp. P36-A1 TaxID=3252900 RepID=UPI003C2CCD04